MNSEEEVTQMAAGVTGFARAGSKVWTIALTSVGFFMVTLDTLVVITVLPGSLSRPDRWVGGAVNQGSDALMAPRLAND
jgi:hypothetical protein